MMSSRNYRFSLFMAVVFLALFIFDTHCSSSQYQADRNRRAPRGGGDSRAQANLGERYGQLLKEMKNQGYDVSEAESLGEKARSAMRIGHRGEAGRLLEQAIAKLEALKSNAKPVRIELSVGSPRVYVTEAVPAAASGKEITSYQGAFESRQIVAVNNRVALDIGTTPVWIEEKDESKSKSSDESTESPFAIALAGPVALKNHRYCLDIIKQAGATSVRCSARPEWGALAWGLAEPEKGRFDWTVSDERYLAAKECGLDVIVNIYSICKWDAPDIKEMDVKYYQKRAGHYPNDMEEYLNFVRKAAERYDGDGKEDAPGCPRVKVWIVGTEMDMRETWTGTPQEYAGLFVQTYKAIKDSDPKAVIWIYGSNTYRFILQSQRRGGVIDNFIRPMLRELKKYEQELPDFSMVYPMHCYQNHRPDLAGMFIEFPQKIERNKSTVGNLLKAAGFNDYTFAISDMGSMIPVNDPTGEKTSAQDVIKCYSAGLAHRMKIISWAQSSDALHDTILETGLVSLYGRGRAKNLSFYSYKLMTERLKHSAWDKAEVVRESEGVNIYKFPKKEGNGCVWVAWADNTGKKSTVQDKFSPRVGEK